MENIDYNRKLCNNNFDIFIYNNFMYKENKMETKLQKFKQTNFYIHLKNYIKYYSIIIIIAIMLTSGLLVGLPKGHDINAHMSRSVRMITQLKEGQIPPLVISKGANGFGYSWNLFYPPLAPYLMTILRIISFSWDNALKLLIIIAVITAGISMFKLIEELTKNKKISLIGAIIYMSSPYFLTDFYIRMALGEVLSYAAFPILFLGLHNLFYGNGHKFTLIVVGAVIVLLSHNISALFAVLLSAIYVLFNINLLNNKEIWKKIGISASFIILIVAFFYIPFLQAKNSTLYEVFVPGKMSSAEKMTQNSVYLAQILFSPLQDGSSYKLSNPNNIQKDMCLQIGLFIIIPLVFTPFVYGKIDKKHRKNYILTLLVGLICIICSTTIIPYDSLPEAITIIQFPWRLLMISTFTLTIIATINIYKTFENIDIKEIMIFTLIIISYVSPLILSNEFYTKDLENNYSKIIPVKEDTKKTISEATFEYLPHKAYINMPYISNRSYDAIILSGNINITEQNKNGSNMIIKYNQADNNTTLELPYIFYPGYNIKINGEKIEYTESENGFIQINLKEKESGEINVKYTGTILAIISWWISLISFVIFIIYNIFLYRKYIKEKDCLLESKNT